MIPERKSAQNVGHDSKRFAKDEEVPKINKTMVEITNDVNLRMTLKNS
jgi:hypothetical protein